MVAIWFSLLLHLAGNQVLAQNPCDGMTVADCKIGVENIIDSHPYPTAEVCEILCDTSDTCNFWRFFKNDTVTECLFLRTNYHQVREGCQKKPENLWSFAKPTTDFPPPVWSFLREKN